MAIAVMDDDDPVLNQRSTSDLELVVDGKSFWCHKRIMTKRSDYINQALKTFADDDHVVVEIDIPQSLLPGYDSRPATKQRWFEIYLKNVYRVCCPIKNPIDCLALAGIASLMGSRFLVDFCDQLLSDHPPENNDLAFLYVLLAFAQQCRMPKYNETLQREIEVLTTGRRQGEGVVSFLSGS
ncbi:hypothetical protein BVRB_030350 [Beta vulgaris subsp. vulgaris]|uniref:BTB domain-containing protein n=1 Tax=Beta vulgaris subsp. vulgaris TaxID=3555 RepID=A0A0J8DS29_BETVV|nr:hypothetical protein BVRB_030350 [Beta vulgaris subsp. vulgaris]